MTSVLADVLAASLADVAYFLRLVTAAVATVGDYVVEALLELFPLTV